MTTYKLYFGNLVPPPPPSTVTEAAAATDVASVSSVSYMALLTEGLSASDSCDATISYAAGFSVSEAAAAADNADATFSGQEVRTESTSATDASAATVVFAALATESATALDFPDVHTAYAVSRTEAASATDSSDAFRTTATAVTEAANALDTPDAFTDAEALVQEAAHATDLVDVSTVEYIAHEVEQANATDLTDAQWIARAGATEAANATDSCDATYVFANSYGSQVLYKDASPLERSIADVESWAMWNINAELIIENWDPYLVQTRNIPYLAFGLGVTLWEDDFWAEGTQRQWLADQWTYKSIRGTIGGIRMALDVSNYDLVDYVTPPQGFYVSPDLPPEEWNAWIKQMPELRFTYAPKTAIAGLTEGFYDDGFLDDCHVSINDGFALRGRYAFLRQNGVVTPLDIIDYQPLFEDVNVVEYERVSVPGVSNLGFFVDESFLDQDDQYLDQEDIAPQLYTVRLETTAQIDVSQATLTTITPTLTPLTPSFEVNSDVGDGGQFMFLDADFVSDGYIDGLDGGDKLLAQRIYLLDPVVQVPMMLGMSFLDADRLGMPTFTEELMVDLHGGEPLPATFVGEAFLDDAFLVAEDTSDVDRALRAIIDAKALRDTALVSFAPRRPVAMGDVLTEATSAIDWVADTL